MRPVFERELTEPTERDEIEVHDNKHDEHDYEQHVILRANAVVQPNAFASQRESNTSKRNQ